MSYVLWGSRRESEWNFEFYHGKQFLIKADKKLPMMRMTIGKGADFASGKLEPLPSRY